LIFAGDLNVDLKCLYHPLGDPEIFHDQTACGMNSFSYHFYQRHCKRFSFTWRQRRKGQVVSSHNDAILSSERHDFTNHFMLVATLRTSFAIKHKRYVQGRKRVPQISVHDFGSTEELDNTFTDVQQHCVWALPSFGKIQPD
jgi:hypothetical protein